ADREVALARATGPRSGESRERDPRSRGETEISEGGLEELQGAASRSAPGAEARDAGGDGDPPTRRDRGGGRRPLQPGGGAGAGGARLLLRSRRRSRATLLETGGGHGTARH